MTTTNYSGAINRIAEVINRDMKEGCLFQIDHVWVRPDYAPNLGLKDGDQVIIPFDLRLTTDSGPVVVPLPFRIIVSSVQPGSTN
ncbi:MAG: hypothetical protein WCP24_03160, partial [bacterium]